MRHDAIVRAVELAGLHLPEDVEVEVDGEDPILPSPHRLGEGAAVARLLTGVGAGEMWRTRTGRPQSLHVDARHAAASLTSFRHTFVHDESRRRPLDVGASDARVIGIHATADGRHVQLHGSFTDGPAVLDVLGLVPGASGEAIAGAVARWDAEALEAALIVRRLCGGVVRTSAEWAAHPQGRALAGRPVVTITQIGDAPARPLPDGDRPASGVRVLDLTRVLAGPTVAKTLAEHGADVLHVTGPGLERGGPFEVDTGIGKRQTLLDLDDPAHVDALWDLVAGADVFSQGYRRGAMSRRGLGPEAVAAVRPGIVYVSENCYGPVGPWAERPGWEQLAQAATGMSHREGAPGAPRLAPAAVNDYTTGYLGAYGAMVALARRAVDGGSWLVEVSLAQTSDWYLRLGDDVDPHAVSPLDVSDLLTTSESPDLGTVTHLRPALSMSESEPRWDLPPCELGAHEPTWASG